MNSPELVTAEKDVPHMEQAADVRDSGLRADVQRIRVVWRDSQYRVNVPNWNGGEVVLAADYDSLKRELVKAQQLAMRQANEIRRLQRSGV